MKRFSLTKSCLVAAPCVLASAASAELATFTFELDSYASEARWAILDANSSTLVYSAPYYENPLLGGSLYVSASLMPGSSTPFGSSYYSYTFEATLDLPAGDYTMVLIDTYGDGWFGGGGVTFSGAAEGESFGITGSQAFGSFTVVPAPASLALLGMAGLRRRRRN